MADASCAIGDVIGDKYRVERRIAEGGMGIVVEATHVALGQRFAVKLLRPAPSDQDAAVARLLEEARLAARLPGDHVARALDAGLTDSGEPYFVMELLVGCDLEAELQARGRLPVDEAVEYVLQACEGVAEAHAVGLVHRDIKPANVFLTRRRDGSPLVKMLDFGVASWVAQVPRRHADEDRLLCGTPAYMAPEQFANRTVDARCDQYALAVVLYELLSGCRPFAAPTVAQLSRVVQTAPPQPLRELVSDVPAPLARAIERALAKDPNDRFADLASFARVIARYGGRAGKAAAQNVALVLGQTESMRETDPGWTPVRLSFRAPTRRPSRIAGAVGALLTIGLVGWTLDALDGSAAARPRAQVGTASFAARAERMLDVRRREAAIADARTLPGDEPDNSPFDAGGRAVQSRRVPTRRPPARPPLVSERLKPTLVGPTARGAKALAPEDVEQPAQPRASADGGSVPGAPRRDAREIFGAHR